MDRDKISNCYRGPSNVHLNEMMKMSALDCASTLSWMFIELVITWWLFIVLIHWHYTPRQKCRSTRILSWFWANQSLFLLYNDVCLAEMQRVVNGNTNFIVYAVHSWGNNHLNFTFFPIKCHKRHISEKIKMWKVNGRQYDGRRTPSDGKSSHSLHLARWATKKGDKLLLTHPVWWVLGHCIHVVLIEHKQSDYATLFQVRFVDIGGIVDHHCFSFLS